MKIPPALQVKTFGMPRWAWLAMLGAGIGVGIILRRRSAAAAEAAAMAAPDPTTDATGPAPDDSLAAQDDPGLAGVGTVGPGAGSVVPVQTPEIPQGYPETFGTLGQVVSDLAGALGGTTAPSTTTNIYNPKPPKKPKKPPPPPKPPKPKPGKPSTPVHSTGHPHTGVGNGVAVTHTNPTGRRIAAPTGGGPPTVRPNTHRPPPTPAHRRG